MENTFEEKNTNRKEIDELKEKLENNKSYIEIIVDNGNVFNVYDISDVIYNEEENVLEIHTKAL